jgi:hypothetical protein
MNQTRERERTAVEMSAESDKGERERTAVDMSAESDKGE